ncbi:FAD-dependent monooxygenase [Actinocrispum sp. NPDC049592]|uniref:FAD-dependent monooxygenase n=1 Tax=Actinocrispum sp. NPDC049592 TaxID=3154835 RepID=UPI00343D20E7
MDVLIVGAGPTGLALAVDLARRGVPVRIVDREIFAGSRGKGLQLRTLEILDDLGVLDAINAAGRSTGGRIYMGGKVVRETPAGASLIIPQWSVNEALTDRLSSLGITVETAEVTSFEQDAGGVTAHTASGEAIRAKFMIGCDGGRSTIRKQLGVPFDGETEEQQMMHIGDFEVEGLTNDGMHMWIDPDRGMFALTPFKATKVWQCQVAPVPGEPSLETFQRLCTEFTGRTDIKLSNPTWMSTYRENVRMVSRFRVGRVFLAGDAAHVHPPAGGLGMNTGIQDAYNLGWKLARTLDGTASPTLLDTYEQERLPVAAWTLRSSSQAMTDIKDAITSGTGAIDKGIKPEHRQLGIGYPDSPLSKNLVTWDGPQAGERAPWQDLVKGTGFTLLAFGCAARPIPGVQTHELPGEENVLVLVRPDGYIGMVAAPDDWKSVVDYAGRP